VSGTVVTSTGAPASGADVKLILRGADSHYVFRSVIADQQGTFLFSGVPPGSYDLVALTDAVRDWEFGPIEWSKTEASANRIIVGDSVLSPAKLGAVTLSYHFDGCTLAKTQ